MRKKNSSILDETEQLLLHHEWETVFLLDKRSHAILFQEEFVGDPTCGLIDKGNRWVIVGGDHLIIWE